jgi:hypothetical protein
VVNPLPPETVTLTATSHTLRRGAQLRLHGLLSLSECCLPPPRFVHRHVILLARHDRDHAFRRIATAVARTRTVVGGYRWSLQLHPGTKTIYIAKLNYQPEGEQGWRKAWSRSFKVLVRH